MADIYGITSGDIANELSKVFPDGFTETTAPTDEAVESFITTADRMAALAVLTATGADASGDDESAPIARRYVINKVLAIVVRIAYAGQAPGDVAAASDMYERAAALALTELKALPPATVVASTSALGSPSRATRTVSSWF